MPPLPRQKVTQNTPLNGTKGPCNCSKNP
jgi:hypothetical protein